MLAPCGLVCTECDIYKAAHDPVAAERLAAKWREGAHKNAVADWFRCRGCHGDDALVWTEDCRIRHCCKYERKLQHCGECDRFPCALITKFENDGWVHHRAAIANLRRLRTGQA